MQPRTAQDSTDTTKSPPPPAWGITYACYASTYIIKGRFLEEIPKVTTPICLPLLTLHVQTRQPSMDIFIEINGSVIW